MTTEIQERPPEILAKECAALNDLEQFLATCPKPPECRLEHRFTPGLYSRTIFMPKGMLLTSRIHRTEHQFVVSMGHCKVWYEDRGWVELKAPHIGITKRGTRRALWILEDAIWTTFHPTELTDIKEIEAYLVEPHDIPKHAEESP